MFPAVSVGMTSAVTAVDRGLAGGLIPTAQQVGGAIFLAVLATIAASTTRHSGSLVEGYRTSYLVAAGFIAVTAVFVACSAMRPASG